jgi:hypothetical protein
MQMKFIVSWLHFRPKILPRKSKVVDGNNMNLVLRSNMEKIKDMLLQSKSSELVGFNNRKPWQMLSN